MDEHYKIFLEGMGPAIDCTGVTDRVLKKYKDKLPDQLLEYWKEYGFCGYADGLFWVVNPDDYATILKMWLGKHSLWKDDNYFVLGRSAFGELFVWSEKRGHTIDIQPLNNWILPDPYAPDEDLSQEDLDLELQIFFSGRDRNDNDKNDDNGNGMFKRAMKELGTLKHDEMYALKLAPVLGGEVAVENLQIVKIREHLMILADMADPETVDVSNY